MIGDFNFCFLNRIWLSAVIAKFVDFFQLWIGDTDLLFWVHLERSDYSFRKRVIWEPLHSPCYSTSSSFGGSPDLSPFSFADITQAESKLLARGSVTLRVDNKAVIERALNQCYPPLNRAASSKFTKILLSFDYLVTHTGRKFYTTHYKICMVQLTVIFATTEYVVARLRLAHWLMRV